MLGSASLLAEIENRRKELSEALHHGSADMKKQWEELDLKWNDFAAKAQLRETSEEVGEALRLLGSELVKGYDRLRAALHRQTKTMELPAEMRPRVEELAYELWNQRGCPLGNPDVDWLEAERQVLGTEHEQHQSV